MNGGCRLNNKSMRNIRKDATYQGLLMDLTMLGIISQKDCEMLLGCGIPQNITLPNGKRGLVATLDALKEPATAPVQDEPVPDTQDTDDTPDTGDDTPDTETSVGNDTDGNDSDDTDTGDSE